MCLDKATHLHGSTYQAAEAMIFWLFQLNPSLAHSAGALWRKSHVDKVYRDLPSTIKSKLTETWKKQP